ncbi:hypothetical protein Scep_010222 [Stephania cephalantha]|uniref:Translation initiation factor eIF2B subunit epsilon n=1 Tax=Stephania cephalantha TaxID=152367 RepID=A0AAP0JUL5_9MAGN
MSTSFDIPNGQLMVLSADASKVGISGAGYIWSACEAGHEEEWRHSVAPIPQDKLEEVARAALAELDLVTQESSHLPASGELKPGSETANSLDGENEEAKADFIDFEREVEATFLRAVHEGVEQEHVILEVNSLRLSYNMPFTDCAGAIFYAMMKLALESPHSTNNELHKNVAAVVTKWGGLLQHYLQTEDEVIEVILKFEEMCLESTREFSPLFAQILHLLYDKDILSEDAILSWASEKEGGDEADKIFVKQSEVFIQDTFYVVSHLNISAHLWGTLYVAERGIRGRGLNAKIY